MEVSGCHCISHTVGVIKNAPSQKKSSKIWRFLAVVYNVVFSVFIFFLAQGKADMNVGGFIVTQRIQWPP